MQKFGLNCNYFSKAEDCGLIPQKTEGSLAKDTGRTGIFGYGLLDLDLTVLVGLIQDLIQAVAYGSGGQERLGAWAAALGRRSSAPAAALRRRRPISAFPGRIRAGPGPRSTYAARVSHWWALRGEMGTGRGRATVGAARRGEVSPAQARAATGGAIRLKQLAQKHGE